MLLFDRARLLLRWRWQRFEARLIDQRFLERGSYNVQRPGSYQLWEYMVELPGSDGSPVRLTIKEKTFKVNLPEIGGTVPVLVNRERTKAVFDLRDPRIDAVGALDAREEARRARDDARFEARLEGRDPVESETSPDAD